MSDKVPTIGDPQGNGGIEVRLDPDPIRQFSQWLVEAGQSGLPNPNAMTLATATPGGIPSARMVLLKGHGPGGFYFYTNYDSPKARELDANPRAALVFFWDSLWRQVRVMGPVHRATREQSEAYFHSRPRESQLGAWASPQSEAIADRRVLEKAYREIEQRFDGQEVPLPPNWGGYAVVPEIMEFWLGGNHRLHDRFRYRRVAADAWELERLAP